MIWIRLPQDVKYCRSESCADTKIYLLSTFRYAENLTPRESSQMPSPHQVEEASAMYEDSMEVRHHGTSKPILPTPATTTSTPHNSPSLRHESVSYSSSEVLSDEYSEYQSSSEFDDSQSLSFESGESSASDLLMRKPAITFLDEADERSAVPGYTYPVPSKPLNINSYKVYSPDNPFKPGGSNKANRLPSVKTNVQLTPTDSYGVPKGSPIGVYSSENPFKPGGSDSQPSTSYSPENPFQPSNQYSTPGSDEVRGYSGSVDSAYQTPSTPSKGNQQVEVQGSPLQGQQRQELKEAPERDG